MRAGVMTLSIWEMSGNLSWRHSARKRLRSVKVTVRDRSVGCEEKLHASAATRAWLVESQLALGLVVSLSRRKSAWDAESAAKRRSDSEVSRPKGDPGHLQGDLRRIRAVVGMAEVGLLAITSGGLGDALTAGSGAPMSGPSETDHTDQE